MSDDFAAIVEFTDPKIIAQLKALEKDLQNPNAEIGKFDPKTNRLEIRGCPALIFQPYQESTKRSVLFRKTPDGYAESRIKNLQMFDAKKEIYENDLDHDSPAEDHTVQINQSKDQQKSLPRAFVVLRQSQNVFAFKNKDESTMRSQLIEMFSVKKEMSYDEIKNEIGDGGIRLKSIIEDICEKRRDSRSKIFYCLKNQYLTDTAKEEARKNKRVKP